MAFCSSCSSNGNDAICWVWMYAFFLLRTRRNRLHLWPKKLLSPFMPSITSTRMVDGMASSPVLLWNGPISLMIMYFIDVLGDEKYITWHSGPNARILDYVFCSWNAHHLVTNSNQQHLSPEWTGHELLGFSFQFVDASGRGPGSGKADPFLAGSKALAEFLIGSEEGLSTIKRFSTLQ